MRAKMHVDLHAERGSQYGSRSRGILVAQCSDVACHSVVMIAFHNIVMIALYNGVMIASHSVVMTAFHSILMTAFHSIVMIMFQCNDDCVL
jgi:hypothetical protein